MQQLINDTPPEICILIGLIIGAFIGNASANSMSREVDEELAKEAKERENKLLIKACKCDRYEFKQVLDVDGSNWRCVCKDCGRSEKTKTPFMQKNRADYMIE